MKIYSYVVVNDSGFAPNPFNDFCSLACCKPVIRRNASVGDWIVGTGSKDTVGNNKLIYAMKITEKMDFNSYYHDKRFQNRSDNIYYKENGKWIQSENKSHFEEDLKHDLSGKYVLVSKEFYYFGKDAITIPKEFSEIIKRGPGHKCYFLHSLVNDFIKWIENNNIPGKKGDPYVLNQESYVTGCN
ncbi:MAG: hypothetical protein ACLQG5_04285 [Methanobacterium sp.]